MKHLYNQQWQSFAPVQTKFIYNESGYDVDSYLEIEPEITGPDFLEKKEKAEQAILDKMQERFVRQGDTPEQAHKRALESLERLRTTLKSAPEDLEEFNDDYFSNYKQILAAFEENSEAETLGKANEVFEDFKTKSKADKLVFKNIGKELKDKMKNARFDFYKGKEGDHVFFREGNSKRINVIKSGIVSVLPAYDHEGSIIGIITLDGDGDTAVSYFDTKYATRDFNEELKETTEEQRSSKASIMGTNNTEQAHFDEYGKKHSTALDTTEKDVESAVKQVIIHDEEGSEIPTKPFLAKTKDPEAHKRGFLNVADTSEESTETFFTADAEGKKLTVTKKSNIDILCDEWEIPGLKVETDNSLAEEELTHLVKMFYRKIITNYDRKNAIVQRGDKKYKTDQERLEAVKEILENETIVFTKNNNVDHGDKLVFRIKESVTVDENTVLNDSNTGVGEFLRDVHTKSVSKKAKEVIS